MASVTNEDVIKKHDQLKLVAAEIQTIRATSVFQRLTANNEAEARYVVDTFAFGKLPEEPMKALMFFLSLREQAQSLLKLAATLSDIETANESGIRALLAGRPPLNVETEEDLTSGQV